MYHIPLTSCCGAAILQVLQALVGTFKLFGGAWEGTLTEVGQFGGGTLEELGNFEVKFVIVSFWTIGRQKA